MECVRLRVKDLLFEENQILVRDRQKGSKIGLPCCPRVWRAELAAHLGASQAFAPERSGSGSRRGLPAFCAGPKVSPRGARMGLAICVPRNPFEPRPKVGQTAPPSCQRDESAAGGEGRGAAGWNRQARQLPFSATFVRHAPIGIRLRHPNRPGIARAQGCEHHADLHACDAEAGVGGAESAGWVSVGAWERGSVDFGARKVKGAKIEHPRSNIQDRTSKIEHPRSNIEHRTSNIQPPTSNFEPRTWGAE